jgi:hypothetical protein
MMMMVMVEGESKRGMPAFRLSVVEPRACLLPLTRLDGNLCVARDDALIVR